MSLRSVQFIKYRNFSPSHLPGQEGLHSNLCVAGPGQACPPLMAAGFVQVLVLFCTPLPHLVLHSDQPDHEDHPPLTE